jgi:hypothetical protein|tara:strand:+ start:757 stop:1092 length:336 start_codon:yes stop_codon:yes gene_type:complete
MQDWIIYTGCVLLGIIAGGGSCLGAVWLYGQLDDLKHWGKARDAIAKAALYVGAVALACVVGWIYGGETPIMGHSVGALWGGAGGILGCAGLFGKVQAAAAALVSRKGAAL